MSISHELLAAGIPEEDIQTATIRLAPRYGESPERGASTERTVVAYRAMNAVDVRVTDLASMDELLSAAVKAGGNRVDAIRFQVGDPTPYLEQARASAWADAQAKADQLAGLADAALGEALTIDESSRTPGPVVRGEVEAAAIGGVPVQPGSQTIEVNLNVTWRLQ